MSAINAARVAVILAALTATPAFAEWWASVGYGPASDGGGTSIAYSGKSLDNWGVSIGAVLNSEFNEDVLDYPVPHNDYKNLGTKRTGSTLGIDALYFFGDNPKLRTYAGVGLYFTTRKEVAQSNVTGWYYTQSDKSTSLLSAELGVQLINDSGLILGMGLHSVRGPTISIGTAF